MTNEERKKAGYLWVDYKESEALQMRQRSLAYDFNHTRPSDVERRQELLGQIFGKLGEKVWIEQPISVSFGKTVSIGDMTYINSNLNLVDDEEIHIGSRVLIAPNVTIITTGHPVHKDLRQHGEMYSAPVTIGDNVWLCAGCIIGPGVTVGEGSVVAAGAVVLSDVPPNTIVGGIPAKVIREITDRDKEYYYRERKLSDTPGMPPLDE